MKDVYKKYHPDFPLRMFFGLPNSDSNTDEAHINSFTLPRFIPDYREYRLMAFVRNPYNRFMSAFKTGSVFDGQINQLWHRHNKDPRAVCEYLLRCDFATQDSLLRSPQRPWFLPQYLFMRPGVEVLRYESAEDWKYLFETLSIGQAKIKVQKDYEIDTRTKEMIRELYFDDAELFEMYK